MRMNVGKRSGEKMNQSITEGGGGGGEGVLPEQLVHVEFNECNRYCLLLLAVLSRNFVDSLRDVLQHEVQVDLVLLLAAGVEKIQEAHDVAVVQPSRCLRACSAPIVDMCFSLYRVEE